MDFYSTNHYLPTGYIGVLGWGPEVPETSKEPTMDKHSATWTPGGAYHAKQAAQSHREITQDILGRATQERPKDYVSLRELGYFAGS